ncbi:MAG: phage replisome organizer N-terminal domain-containing protein [Clostridia bacterium]|nr:phage replisome organizer N-terminal domain-containing protein [Clostridia bacterium]
MAEIKWIKLSTDVFNNRKIRQIECMPDGDTIIVIWFKILALAGEINDSGQVYLTKEIPYTEQLLATQFNRPIATVRLALQTFQQFGMIEIIDNLILVSNWEKYQNIEGMERVREQTRLRVARFRENKRLAECNATSNATSRYGNAGEEEKEEDKDKNSPPIVPPTGETPPSSKRFSPPSVEEVADYCRERNNGVNAEQFVDFYSSKGWKVGSNPMKDWKAAVRTWEQRNGRQKPNADRIDKTYNPSEFFERAVNASYWGKQDGG